MVSGSITMPTTRGLQWNLFITDKLVTQGFVCHTVSGPPPPRLSIATMHGPPTIYERVQGLGFG